MKFDKIVKRLLKESEQTGPPYTRVNWQQGPRRGKTTTYYKDPERTILHREGGPAVIAPDYTAWYIDNMRHREGGPAYVTMDGVEIWFAHDLRHRVNGPAVISNGETEWWINGNKLSPKEIEEQKQKIALDKQIASDKNNPISGLWPTL